MESIWLFVGVAERCSYRVKAYWVRLRSRPQGVDCSQKIE